MVYLNSFLRNADHQFGIANQEYTQYVLERLQMFCREVGIIEDILSHSQAELQNDLDLQELPGKLVELKRSLTTILTEWERYNDTLASGAGAMSAAYRVESVGSTGLRGRPRFQVQKEQLEYLSSLGFSWTAIAALLGVSRMTVYRRRQEYGLLRDPQSTLSDQDLTTVLRHLRSEHPYIGETMVIGHLRAMGYHVPREKVRTAIRTTDPINTALRWRSLTPRRPYSVPGPNSLWHIGKS